MANPSSEESLSDALHRYELQLEPGQVQQLEHYCQLLWQWNQRLNLTRHTDYDKFVTRDLYDTLQLAGLLEPGEQILDVGTGGGVPGLPLAILRPDLDVSVCESVGKKAQAVEAMVAQLKLPVTVYQARAEDLLGDFAFEVLVARAVGPLWKLCKWFHPHWASIGRLLVIKGPRWSDERLEARHRGVLQGVELRKAAAYRTPGIGARNVILKLWGKRGRSQNK